VVADKSGGRPAGRARGEVGPDQNGRNRLGQPPGPQAPAGARDAQLSVKAPPPAPEENAQAESDRREPGHPADPYDNFNDSMEDRVSLTEALEQALRTFASPPVQQWNQNVFYGSGGPLDAKQGPRAVPQSLLERIRRTFVQPPDYWKLLAELEKRSLVLLTARAGSGRNWTAQFLLDATCGGRIRRIDEIQAGSFAADAIAPFTGYLWSASTPMALNELDSDRLDVLAAELRDRWSRAVVLVPYDAVQSMPGALAEYLFILERAPDLTEVLKSHLRALLGRSLGEEADRIVSSRPVAQVLKELGRRDDGCRSVARFAESLKPVAEGMAILEVACEAATAVPWSGDYFRNLQEPEEQEFAIALTVGANHTLSAVAGLARNLGRRVQEAQEPMERPRCRVWFRTTGQLLSLVQAEQFPTRYRTPFGLVSAVGVRSRIDGFPPLLMRTLWQEYPHLQPILIEWLQDLCSESQDAMIRSNAAAAIGVIAGHDFHLVYRDVIEPWSSSFRIERREAAANILGLVARGDLADQVWELLAQWSDPVETTSLVDSDKSLSADVELDRSAASDAIPGSVVPDDVKASLADRRRRQLTAAVALGASVGSTDVPHALELLERQAGYPHAELSWAVGRAVADLAYGSSDEDMLRVVAALASWQASASRARVHAALGAFLQLVWISASGGPGTPKWLRVVRLSGVQDQFCADLARLWRRCLNSARYERVAMDVLKSWLRNLESDASAESVMRNLVGAIPQVPREFRVMRTYLTAWGRRGFDDKPLAFVRQVLDDRERSHA